MLGGVAPILIFTFPKRLALSSASGIPLIGKFIAQNVGIPIPIYLDERLTGVYVQGESKTTTIETDAQQRQDGKGTVTSQRALQNDVTVNLFAKSDSVLLSVLLAMNDLIFKKVVSEEYSVSYLNGPTVILGGLLQRFDTTSGTDDNLLRIALQLSKAKSPAAGGLADVNPLEVGSTPMNLSTVRDTGRIA